MTYTLSDSFELLDGLASVRDRVLARLRYSLGEWYLLPSSGVPYVSSLESGDVSRVVKDVALSVADVDEVEVYKVDLSGRALELRLRVRTRFGDTDIGIG